MAHRAVLKTTFEPARVIQPIFTGGDVALSRNGKILVSCVDQDVLLTDFGTQRELARIEGDGETVTSLSCTPSASYLIVCSRSLSMKIYALQHSEAEDGSHISVETKQSLKPHATPVVTCEVDRTGTLVATGAADGNVKVWDIRGGFATHNLHGHGGVISALHFFEVENAESKSEPRKKQRSHSRGLNGDRTDEDDPEHNTIGYRLASGGEDGKIRIWNLHKRSSQAVLDSHVSVIRSLHYSHEEKALVSGSRDKTVMIWDSTTWKIRSTIPVLEAVEAVGFLNRGSLVYTGGENGTVRLWRIKTGTEFTTQQRPGTETEAILQIMQVVDLAILVSVHADQTLLLHSLEGIGDISNEMTEPLRTIRRIVGTHDEIIDMAFCGPDKRFLALATNTEDIRIINTTDSHNSSSDLFEGGQFGAEADSLRGHDEIIICLDADSTGNWLATGAKDNTARLWRFESSIDKFTCFGTCTGHTESIGAVALPKSTNSGVSQPQFLVTGSQDKSIKRWTIPSATSGGPIKALYTRKAHDKDINALALDPTCTLLASASQDRTVKIWTVADGVGVGVLRGHKRGVWSATFAPSSLKSVGSTPGGKGFLATASGDKTVKVWNLSDYSCLQTYEGHTNSVLKVVFLRTLSRPDDDSSQDKRGQLIASSGSDGLVKVWDLSTGEAAATLDNHTDRVWALAVNPSSSLSDESTIEPALSLVSGAADGVLTFWADTTTQTASLAIQRQSLRIEQDQELQNLTRSGNFREAITLALQLDHPARLFALFKSVVEAEDRDPETLTGNCEVDAVLGSLADEQIVSLLLRIRDWNTNARSASVAQRVLYAVVRSYSAKRLAGLRMKGKERGRKAALREVLDAIAAYTERHLRRTEELVEESYLLDFTLGEMDAVGGVGVGVDGEKGLRDIDMMTV